jgi:hypothetical protein
MACPEFSYQTTEHDNWTRCLPRQVEYPLIVLNSNHKQYLPRQVECLVYYSLGLICILLPAIVMNINTIHDGPLRITQSHVNNKSSSFSKGRIISNLSDCLTSIAQLAYIFRELVLNVCCSKRSLNVKHFTHAKEQWTVPVIALLFWKLMHLINISRKLSVSLALGVTSSQSWRMIRPLHAQVHRSTSSLVFTGLVGGCRSTDVTLPHL